jgi:hypothetical protein
MRAFTPEEETILEQMVIPQSWIRQFREGTFSQQASNLTIQTRQLRFHCLQFWLLFPNQRQATSHPMPSRPLRKLNNIEIELTKVPKTC